jgi:hypothetical protein
MENQGQATNRGRCRASGICKKTRRAAELMGEMSRDNAGPAEKAEGLKAEPADFNPMTCIAGRNSFDGEMFDQLPPGTNFILKLLFAFGAGLLIAGLL